MMMLRVWTMCTCYVLCAYFLTIIYLRALEAVEVQSYGTMGVRLNVYDEQLRTWGFVFGVWGLGF
jgi:hypothetical protein